jgi:hypothetical protein
VTAYYGGNIGSTETLLVASDFDTAGANGVFVG